MTYNDIVTKFYRRSNAREGGRVMTYNDIVYCMALALTMSEYFKNEIPKHNGATRRAFGHAAKHEYNAFKMLETHYMDKRSVETFAMRTQS